MKKLVALLLAMVMTLAVCSVLAEGAEQSEEVDSGSKFESVMLKKRNAHC